MHGGLWVGGWFLVGGAWFLVGGAWFLVGGGWFFGVEFHAGGGSPDFGASCDDDGGAGDVAAPEVVEDVADDPGLAVDHGGGDGGETLLGGGFDGEVVGFLVHEVWLVLGFW